MDNHITYHDNKTGIMDIVTKSRGFSGLKELQEPTVNPGRILNEIGLNYQLEKKTLKYEGNDGYLRTVNPRHAIVRSDNGNCMGIVGDSYQIAQNSFIAATACQIAEQVGGKITHVGELESGAFDKGSRVAFHADLGDFDIGGDQMKKQLIVVDGRDGSMSLSIYLGIMRIICSNGMMAYDKSFQNCIRVQHSNKIPIMVNYVIQAMAKANDVYENTKAKLEEYQTYTVHPEEAIQSLSAYMFPKTMVMNTKTNKKELMLTQRTVRKRQRLVSVYNEQSYKEHDVYRVYQAATEYIDHENTISVRKDKDAESSYFTNMISGSGNELKKTAIEACDKMVAFA